MKVEQRREFIINTLYFLLIVGIVYISIRFAIYAMLPFVVGFAAAALINPLLRFLSTRFELRRRPVGIMLLLIFYATIGMLITIVAVRLTVFIGELSGDLPELYKNSIEPALNKVFELTGKVADFFDRILGGRGGLDSSELGGLFGQIKTSLGTAVSELSVKVLARVSSFAAAIPGVIVGVIFAVISSFFFTLDYEKIIALAKRFLPENVTRLLSLMRGRLMTTVGRYLRSYLLIMLITFAELALGFTLLKVERAFTLAGLIALFDVLPVLGVGGIIVPWAAISLSSGDTRLAIGLVILWAVISLIRNIIEPKIVGDQVGLPPLATLAAMFVGTKLFGIAGLFLLPIALAVIKPIFDSDEKTVAKK